MSLKEYLKNIKLPDVNPEGFDVKLKYELKKEFFHSKHNIAWFSIASAAMAAVFMILFSIMVFSPTAAGKVHYALFKTDKAQIENPNNFNLPLASGRSLTARRSNNYATGNGAIQVVSDLSQLDPNKSYMVKKVTNKGRVSRYYVSEVQAQRRRPRGPVY